MSYAIYSVAWYHLTKLNISCPIADTKYKANKNKEMKMINLTLLLYYSHCLGLLQKNQQA